MNEEWERFVSRRVKRGREQGLEEGLKLGANERAQAIAKALMAKGLMSIADIAESTGLSVNDVEGLKTA